MAWVSARAQPGRGDAREGGAWKNHAPGTCDRWSARPPAPAMSSDVSGTESGSESGPESVPEPVPEPGPEPESEPGPGPAPGPGPGPAPGPGPGLGREPGQRYQPCQLCPEHGKPLSWFCLSERRPVCATCAGFGGRCHRHRIRRAEEHAEELRVSGHGAGN